MVEYLKFL